MRQQYDSNSRSENRSTSRGDHNSDRGMFGWNDDRERRRTTSRDHGDDDRRHRDRDERDPKYGPDAHREGMPR